MWLLLPLECSLSWGVGAVVTVASDKRFAVHVGSLIVWWDMSNAFHIASFFSWTWLQPHLEQHHSQRCPGVSAVWSLDRAVHCDTDKAVLAR